MKARVVEAPAVYEHRPDDHVIFLAGGITGVPDWQSEAIELLGERDVVILNPRRASFDVGDPDAGPAQIAWEVGHLRMADLTLFWFPACDPAVTVQPIALLELGMAIGQMPQGRRFVVGADRGYPRRLDVVEQCYHARPYPVTVEDSLQSVVTAALAQGKREGVTAGSSPGGASLLPTKLDRQRQA